jgi:hypothetical protein
MRKADIEKPHRTCRKHSAAGHKEEKVILMAFNHGSYWTYLLFKPL